MLQIKQHAQESICKILVGNKCDVAEGREVTFEEGNKLAESYGIQFFETSAKENKNVSEVFYSIAKEIKDSKLVNMPKQSSSMAGEKQAVQLSSKKKRQGSCC